MARAATPPTVPPAIAPVFEELEPELGLWVVLGMFVATAVVRMVVAAPWASVVVNTV